MPLHENRLPPEPLSLDQLAFVGSGLSRPECVLATARGDLYTADWRGGVAHVRPDGTQALYTGSLPGGRPLRPNGIALLRDGSFLLADLGATQGGVFHLDRSGSVRPYLMEADGVELPPSNFVAEDSLGRVWVTVSTRKLPRELDFRPDCGSGFIVLKDASGVRIVADGLGYTNEAIVSPDGAWLYVNETYGKRLSRFPLRADGSLGAKEVVTAFGTGTFPDGLTFDVDGHMWITSIISNRVICVAPDGSQQIVLEDAEQAHLERCEAAYRCGTLERKDVDRPGRVLKNISSLAFGGRDLRTAYLGCLLGDSIASFHAPVAGYPPPHWQY